nr:cathepsin l [Bemisia tabaci]
MFLNDVVHEEFELFLMAHGLKYNNDIEESFRLKIFMENKHKIAKHNQRHERGEVSYKLPMNHFGDMLHHEFKNVMNGYKQSLLLQLGADAKKDASSFLAPANVVLPRAVYWRTAGAVTPVKNQGHWGSCWSFSTTGALEGQHFRKTGRLLSLSEQNLIDCSTRYGNQGCNGGLMDQAFQYIKDNQGIDTEISYPYEEHDDKCRYKPRQKGATDKGFTDIESGSESDLKAAVATVGPISVAIDASAEDFQFYSEGVYYTDQCNSTQLDHGVLVVGYGTTEYDEYYWDC